MAEEIPNIDVLHTLAALCLSIVFKLDCANISLKGDVIFYCTTLCFRVIRVQMFCGMPPSNPTSSVSINIFVLRFCCGDVAYAAPWPRVAINPVRPFMSFYTACAPY